MPVSIRVTKIHHACLTIDDGRTRLLLDPGQLGRHPGLDGIDAVLITHRHSDHLDTGLVEEALRRGIPVWAPGDALDELGGLGARGEDGLREALRRPASLVVIESPTNPMMALIDVAAAARLAHSAGALLAVDNTFLTPYLCRPLELGADAVLYSATKYLSGHNDVMAGAIVVSDEEAGDRVQYRLNTTGATLSPFDCFLLLRGLKTLGVRMDRHEANARAVAAALEESPLVERVLYPGRSGMVSFEVTEGVDIGTFLGALTVFTFAESLGGVESLVTCPSAQTHADVPPERRAAYGLSDRLLRLSVGIEDAEDLVADLIQALEAGAAA
mgnify:CR=1 FL=1